MLGIGIGISPILQYAPPAPIYITSAGDFDAVDWARPAMDLRFQRGLVLRGRSIPALSGGSKTSAFGTGNLPVLLGSTAVATPWTLVSGSVYSTPLGTKPSNVFERTTFTLDGNTKLAENTATPTAPTAGQWGWSSGTLYVFSSTDPNAKNYEQVVLNASSTSALVRVTGNGCVVEGLSLLCSPRNACLFALGVVGGTFQGCDVYGSTQDGVDGDAGVNPPKNILIQTSRIYTSGYGVKDGTGSAGDGVSFHGNPGTNDYFSVTVRGCDIRYNNKSGVGNQSTGLTTAYGNNLQDNWDHFPVYGIGSGTSTPGLHKFYYNVCKSSVNDNRAINAQGGSSLTSPVKIVGHNNVLYGGNRSGRAAVFITDGPKYTYNYQNMILANWSRGFDDSFNNGTIEALDYNCMFGNGTNLYDGGTGNLAAKAGTHNITGNPLFVNAAAGDFHLQAGSPCINAGANLGYTADKDGYPVFLGTAPDIGAYEKA